MEEQFNLTDMANQAIRIHDMVKGLEYAKDILVAAVRTESALGRMKSELADLRAKADEEAKRADTYIAQAKSEADRIIGEANQKAESIIAEAAASAEAIKQRAQNETEQAKAATDSAQTQLQKLKEQLAMLDKSLFEARQEHRMELERLASEKAEAEAANAEAQQRLKQAQEEYARFLEKLHQASGQ